MIWGDWDPVQNSTAQHDVLDGGAGNDFIYSSHGLNTITGGPGDDHIWAFYGHGVIDCGPGRDTVRVRMNGAFKLRGCEIVNHFCSLGSDGHGPSLRPSMTRQGMNPNRRTEGPSSSTARAHSSGDQSVASSASSTDTST